MKFAIVGVGQSFNLETGEMEDTLQVDTPQGMVSIPTSNEAAQLLISLAMNGSEPGVQRGTTGYAGARELASRVEERFQAGTARRVAPPQSAEGHGPVVTHEEFPPGASVFGGGDLDDVPRSQEYEQQLEESNEAFNQMLRQGQEAPVEQQLFQQTQETPPALDASERAAIAKAQRTLGRADNTGEDRSGVPSYTIARVDEKGNPVLPAPPDEDDEDEDPGEQV
jgi:hypothetical protein